MQLKNLFVSYRDQLLLIYPKLEAESLVFWLFESFLNRKRMDILNDVPIEAVPAEMEIALEKLLRGMPIQYILGKAPFYGREFKVGPEVLIPRNETEGLVHLIIKENQTPGLKILDVGTGSGCIPITLALELKNATVFGLDISEIALEMAKENAKSLKADVLFFHCNILQDEIPIQGLDILVSNPPYVRDSEQAQMHQNVLQYEPHLALFVADDNPLIFYRSIAEKGRIALKPGGKLYFEINEAFGPETKKLLEDLGYSEIHILEDLNGRDRMVTGIR
ncbi:peptide chain release factor N(5)-glutamine methyltransferase [Rhodonellum sp.]|uniref:peptide chain release factor N(5)-glutamine methyltransferase n=1 Tax=Rhodonellum sp. TaxID=2231180 RepID=UPI0027242174|nr:peptide chain release factor N(5)-glutamine methyltransferase [Rhodonellum sp.]MDO9552687.1 peptide chain release factor N(5)-glutamine methyltransferase [Rhodonellum sp.]